MTYLVTLWPVVGIPGDSDIKMLVRKLLNLTETFQKNSDLSLIFGCYCLQNFIIFCYASQFST